MTDQYKQNDSKNTINWTNPDALLNMLSGKFAAFDKFQKMQLPSWSVWVFLGILLLVIAWSQIVVSQANSRLEKGQGEIANQLELERSTLIRKAREYADAQYHKEEDRFGQVLSWAVRGELLRNNLDQVSQYLNELVKIKDTERAVLIGDDGKLLVSTDKKLEEAAAKEIYPEELLQQRKITIQSDVNGRKLLIVPIMGLNNRLATVVISYKNPPLNSN